MRLRIACIVFMAVLPGALPGEVADGTTAEATYVPVVLEHPIEAMIPQNLRPLQLSNPRVRFKVVVDATGEILDSMPFEATHFGLLDDAEKALGKAKFKPATLDGKAVSGKISLTITFYDPEQRYWRMGGINAPMGVTVSEAVERRIYDVSKEAYVFRESDPTDLDQPLQLLHSELKVIHPEGQPVKKGSVLVEYFVDHRGRVRLPEIIRSDGEYHSLSVLMTLQETEFAPPTKDGHPTYVRVRQPFNFG